MNYYELLYIVNPNFEKKKIDDTMKEIDNLATIISQKFNEINQSGLDLDGKEGKQMFTVSSLQAVENPTNRSSVGVAVFVTNPLEIKNSEYRVIYHENEALSLQSSLWPPPGPQDGLGQGGLRLKWAKGQFGSKNDEKTKFSEWNSL